MPVVVVATFFPAPDKMDELVEVVTSAIGDVHTEDGCELYSLHRNDDRLVMIEKWTSAEALATHGRAPALAALGPRLRGLVTGAPEVVRLEPVPAGDAAKGAL